MCSHAPSSNYCITVFRMVPTSPPLSVAGKFPGMFSPNAPFVQSFSGAGTCSQAPFLGCP